MKVQRTTSAQILYWLAFALALALRLARLGAAPLSDGEAGWALQALGLAHGGNAALGAQPAYILLTSLLFRLFGDTNFMARLFSALAGSLLVWLPFLLRRGMGASKWLQRAGFVMAFGLAIDPGLVSLSRQVGSPMPAVAFTLLALACFYSRQMIGLGIFVGLAVLSGPAFLQGALILGVGWILIRWLGRGIPQAQSDEGIDVPPLEPIPSRSLGFALAAFLATILAAGTLFLHSLQGLGALADTLSGYLNSWVKPSGVPLLRLPASLLAYQPLVIIFGLVGAGRAWLGLRHNPPVRQLGRSLSIGTLVAAILPVLYAGRQVGDMAWALVPLWGLAALEISRSLMFEDDKSTHLVAAGLTFPLFVLVVFGWINLLSIGRYQVSVLVYWATLLGVVLVSTILVLLVGATWSTRAARLGLVWVLCLALCLQLFSNTWGLAILRQNGAQELWSRSPTTGQADLLNATLADLSSWTTGLRDQLEIVSLLDSPALQWDLRHFPQARFETTLANTESPPAVITLKEVAIPSLAENYRGQDFVWRLSPGWPGVFPPNFISWLAFRQAPLVQEQLVLWARSDVFPGSIPGTGGVIGSGDVSDVGEVPAP